MSDEGDVVDEVVVDGVENVDSCGSGGWMVLVIKLVVWL